MEDWREQYTNCHDCAEFQDNFKPMEMCSKCVCFNCEHDRDKCLKAEWCTCEKMEIQILTKLL